MTLLWNIGNGKRNGKEIEIIDNFEEVHWNRVTKGQYPLDDWHQRRLVTDWSPGNGRRPATSRRWNIKHAWYKSAVSRRPATVVAQRPVAQLPNK